MQWPYSCEKVEVTLNDFFRGGTGTIGDEVVTRNDRRDEEEIGRSPIGESKSRVKQLLLSVNDKKEEEINDGGNERAQLPTALSREVSYRRKLWTTRQRSTICTEEEDEYDEDEKKTEAPEQSNVTPLQSSSFLFPCAVSLSSFGDFATADEGENDDFSFETSSEMNGEIGEQSLLPATIPFSILGLPKEVDHHHDCVLTPPLMDALRMRLPSALKGDNYLLKYSLIRDGASIETLLSKIRTAVHCIIAVETSDGRVLGSFTSTPWRKSTDSDSSSGWFYGSCEAFLWRLTHSRREIESGIEAEEDDEVARDSGDTASSSRSGQALLARRVDLESDVEIFPWSGLNQCVQMCDGRNIIAVGGGEPEEDIDRKVLAAAARGCNEGRNDAAPAAAGLPSPWDFGLALNADLSQGSTGRCATFGTRATGLLSASPDSAAEANESIPTAPPFELANVDVWNAPFDIANVDVWTMTPMFDTARAEELQLGKKLILSTAMANAGSTNAIRQF